MLVPIEWLNDYIDIDVSDEEFCDRMIMSGSNLETCEHFCEEMERVVVGKIEKIEKHPDADKLVVCQSQYRRRRTDPDRDGSTERIRRRTWCRWLFTKAGSRDRCMGSRSRKAA